MSAHDSGAELMRHALGVHPKPWVRGGNAWSRPYRNYYCAGSDYVAAWDALVAAGHAALVRVDPVLSGGCPVYRVTDAGREYALAGIAFSTHRWARYGRGKPVNP